MDTTNNTEPIIAEEVIAPEEVQEPTSLDVADEVAPLEYEGEAFVQELQYGTPEQMNLHLHIKNTGATDDTGKLTPETLELARTAGMTEDVIEQHQASIYKEVERTQQAIHKTYTDSVAELGLKVGYFNEIIDWMRQSFTADEIKTFETGFVNDATGELRALERYYTTEMEK